MIPDRKLKAAFIKAWSGKTTADPQNWSAGNPSWGQCAVTAVLAREIYGGDIVRIAYVLPTGETGSHYFNILPNGERLDLTGDQFCDKTAFAPDLKSTSNAQLIRETQAYLESKNHSGSAADYILSFAATRARYEIYKRSFQQHSPKPP